MICKHIAKQQNCVSEAKLQKRVTNDIPLNENDQIILIAGKLSHPSPNSAAQPAQPTQPASLPANQPAIMYYQKPGNMRFECTHGQVMRCALDVPFSWRSFTLVQLCCKFCFFVASVVLK